jgi:toxin ParE1/3/4
MKVRYSPRAIQDLDSIRRYIARDNPDAAWVVASFIKRSISYLEDWPHSGRATDKENVRRLVVGNYPYVVYYRVHNEVEILTVRHPAQEQ